MKMRLNEIKMKRGAESAEFNEEAKKLMKERSTNKSVVGLFSTYDSLPLERIVGTLNHRKLITDEAKDSYSFA